MAHSFIPPELQNGHGDEDDLEHEHVYLRDRRRAKSLPAYPEQASLFSHLSQRCRKQVKFADALGLTLTSVRHFSIAEDPQVPSEVFAALRSKREPCAAAPARETRLAPEHAAARAKRGGVALETAALSGWAVRGVILAHVADKAWTEVGVRYTFNRWASFADAPAVPVPGERAHADTQTFSFTVHTPPFREPDAGVHFAVYMRTDRGDFWDNNDGQNYRVQCGRVL
ncbi:protein phosphatase 1 regulatory subunit 3G [Clarias magur]|uniref:Protein phosphatase 1 regulatory subunit 3G n=1 Tax=Clarias magur TaxID=1594786 RepID=A0A8J4XE41_CLAMG|nr:protein phosphatase 1 regulatory subunit 3G [Clarias magur]